MVSKMAEINLILVVVYLHSKNLLNTELKGRLEFYQTFKIFLFF